MHAFLVPQPPHEDTDSESSSDASEHSMADTEPNADDNTIEHATKKRRSDETTKDTVPLGAATEHTDYLKDCAATEHTDYLEDCGDEAFPQVITATGSHIMVANASGKTQMFTKSIAHRDDWLHRGEGLRDMDYYHYARHIERVEKPRKGTAHGFQKRYGVYHIFDSHYSLARSHVQVLLKHPKTVQNVGPQCKRKDVNQGEDNAVYKAYFHSCIRCPGADDCANPLMYQALLYPQIDDIDKYLAMLHSRPGTQRIATRFAPAWKARRYEIAMLADRASAKRDRAMRINVIHDTTSFKGVLIPRHENVAGRATDDATERTFEVKMRQIVVQQVIRGTMGHGTCVQHVMENIMICLGIPLPWHRDQPHLSEWQAFSTQEILFNLDNTVDGRNEAQKQAIKHRTQMTTDADQDEESRAADPKIIIEDLGGALADDDGGEFQDDSSGTKHELQLSPAMIMRVLSRAEERDTAGQVGRPKDMHAEMQRVAAIFGTELDNATKAFDAQERPDKAIGVGIHEALRHQKEKAESMRQQQEDDVPDSTLDQDTAHASVQLLTEEAAELLQSIPTDLTSLGPVSVAKLLVDAATLNRDQQGPVALIAQEMQTAWEKQGKPKQMDPIGRILRMLLIGGGGCGKTRIINLVLTAMFIKFWGPRGCVKTAPSNKAARGILGKTLHAASKLRSGSMRMTDLRCSHAVQTALAYLWAPCGALIIDEAPQGAAALYHALAVRSTYGRATAHALEAADYAERSQSFGAMPVVIECGDELQLPPVPASSGLFADHSQAATEHLAGVEIFKQKDYVYRLSTMKRFTDTTQIAILTKMRQSGGCKLTTQEWKALRGTDISTLSATEQQQRLQGTSLWYQSAPTWATVSMAQVIRSRLSALEHNATLYFIPAKDYLLNRLFNPRLTDAFLTEQIAGVPNMNNTGRLPSIAMLHIGMEIRLTNTIETPEAVTDSTGVVIAIDMDPDEPHESTRSQGVRILKKLPLAVIVKLDNVKTEFLPPVPCALHIATGAERECACCDFRVGCIAIETQLSRGSFIVEVEDTASSARYDLKVQRRQLPITIKKASTLNTLQGITATPGLIFHWKFPRFFSAELRWLATYVALSRPESLAQLISVGIPADLRDIIEGGPPEGIISKFDDLFSDIEKATHLRAAEVMRELGWAAAT